MSTDPWNARANSETRRPRLNCWEYRETQADPRFYENLTARETLRFVAGFFYRGPKPAVEQRIQETLELVGLADKADRSVRGFSGDERQRLGIA